MKLRHGLASFFEARHTGQKAVAGFFQANTSKVNAKDVAGRLQDVSKQFKRWSVDVGGTAIRVFVDKKLGAGSYKPGNGYYELTKSELVQAKKEIAIRDNQSGPIEGFVPVGPITVQLRLAEWMRPSSVRVCGGSSSSDFTVPALVMT